MKKLISVLFGVALFCGAALGQEKRPPGREISAQAEHVRSSGNDLLHFRFRQAHEKHLAEAKRRKEGIARDLRGEGEPLPKPRGW